MKLRDYFKENNTDIFEIYLTDNFHIFIQEYMFDRLCIEVCDKNGNSKNVLCDVSLETYICDIKESVLNSIIDSYLYEV